MTRVWQGTTNDETVYVCCLKAWYTRLFLNSANASSLSVIWSHAGWARPLRANTYSVLQLRRNVSQYVEEEMKMTTYDARLNAKNNRLVGYLFRCCLLQSWPQISGFVPQKGNKWKEKISRRLPDPPKNRLTKNVTTRPRNCRSCKCRWILKCAIS